MTFFTPSPPKTFLSSLYQVVERVAERERRRLERLKAREDLQKETEKAEKKRKEEEERKREERRKVNQRRTGGTKQSRF